MGQIKLLNPLIWQSDFSNYLLLRGSKDFFFFLQRYAKEVLDSESSVSICSKHIRLQQKNEIFQYIVAADIFFVCLFLKVISFFKSFRYWFLQMECILKWKCKNLITLRLQEFQTLEIQYFLSDTIPNPVVAAFWN